MTPETVLAIITDLSSAKGAPKTIDPNMVARALAGPARQGLGAHGETVASVFRQIGAGWLN